MQESSTVQILSEALRRFGGGSSDGVNLISESMNRVYEYQSGDRRLVLRIALNPKMTAEMTQAEIDWIDYLFESGLPVCTAISSIHGRKVEIIPDFGTNHIVTAFKMAPGKPIDSIDWNPSLFKQMGQLIGRIHAYSKKYHPDPCRPRRFEWTDSIYIMTAQEVIPKSELMVWGSYKRLRGELLCLPRDVESFGLIHGDFHAYNFFIDQSCIHLFDFDGCEYNWYINDIAVSLFYAILFDTAPIDTMEKVKLFLPAFLNGYSQENFLDGYWLAQIPTFLKLREFLIYGLLYDGYRLGKLPEFLRAFMMNRKERIENNEPFFTFDILA